MSELTEAGTQENGEIDLFGYMLNVIWLDLGQLLYVLIEVCRLRKGFQL